MEEKTVKDFEALGVPTANILLLIDITQIDGTKLRNLWLEHDSAFNDSFDSDSSKQVQLQSLVNTYNDTVRCSDFKIFPMSQKIYFRIIVDRQ